MGVCRATEVQETFLKMQKWKSLWARTHSAGKNRCRAMLRYVRGSSPSRDRGVTPWRVTPTTQRTGEESSRAGGNRGFTRSDRAHKPQRRIQHPRAPQAPGVNVHRLLRAGRSAACRPSGSADASQERGHVGPSCSPAAPLPLREHGRPPPRGEGRAAGPTPCYRHSSARRRLPAQRPQTRPGFRRRLGSREPGGSLAADCARAGEAGRWGRARGGGRARGSVPARSAAPPPARAGGAARD